MPKSSIFVSSDLNAFEQFSSESFRCSLKNFRRAYRCALLSRKTLRALEDNLTNLVSSCSRVPSLVSRLVSWYKCLVTPLIYIYIYIYIYILSQCEESHDKDCWINAPEGVFILKEGSAKKGKKSTWVLPCCECSLPSIPVQ